MYKTNCTIDDCKLFINHDGKCKTEYDFWINKEKLREKFKKEVINKYKEKLINSIKEQIQDELDKGDNGIPYIEALDLIKNLENGDFE